jgi:hypothetical protein
MARIHAGSAIALFSFGRINKVVALSVASLTLIFKSILFNGVDEKNSQLVGF